MKLSELELPSNRKFGFFFTAIFFGTGAYFSYIDSYSAAYTLIAFGLLFLATTLINADLLLPLNKLWMRLGLLLGMVVSPIVLGIIFFGMFMPISFVMRVTGRDELRLRVRDRASHWIYRVPSELPSTFKNQF